MSSVPTIILRIAGASSSGKKTFITRHLTGHFANDEFKEGQLLPFFTSRGLVFFKLTTENKKADAEISFFDSSKRDVQEDAYDHVPLGKISVVAFNKVDIDGHTNLSKVWKDRKFVDYLKDTYGAIYATSGKSNYDFEKPFLYILRQFFDDQSLRLLAPQK